jgi:hypothetical protein
LKINNKRNKDSNKKNERRNIYIKYNKIKNIKNKKHKKNSKFKSNEVSVLIIFVFIPQPPILEMVPQMLFCICLIKEEK